MQARRVMAVGWSSFLAACVLEFLVFACVDPGELQWFGRALPPSRQLVYALSFFVFWAVTALSGALALLLTRSSAEINQAP
ncbi:hypothetical protein [Xenophilus sp.]|uniref:hypothetical protein n=1 Tax=Xenophilus sp. TaxID=1873499 RepID=UPI0037DC09A9